MIKKGAVAIAIAFVIAIISGYIFYEKILLIAGCYWAFVAVVCVVCHFAEKRLREVDDDYRRNAEKEEEEWFAASEEDKMAEESETDETDEPLFQGKHSNMVFFLTFTVIAVVNLLLWITFDPIDETVVAAVRSLFPFNWFGAIVVTAVEAFCIGVCVVNWYEVKTGVEAEDTASLSNGTLIVILMVIAALLMGLCRYSYEIITEDYYQFRAGPIQRTYYWEDMEYFRYDEDVLLSFPMTHVRWNYNSRSYENFELAKYNRLTDAYVDKYNSYRNIYLMDYIFLEKYAYLAQIDEEE